jgi:hypothetical protein
MLAVQLVQAVITTPTVLRVAFGSVTVTTAVDSFAADEAMRLQQEAGIAALIALASRLGPRQPPERTADPRITSSDGRFRARTPVSVTRANPAVSDTNWWPDHTEEDFRWRQEMGMAALIEIATHAANF